jgi:osmotically-inducible protein OsmY
MTAKEAILKKVQALLERETRINLHKFPIRLDFNGGVLTLEGEVEDIAAKKLALKLAGTAEDVKEVEDRLKVAVPAEFGDGAIRDQVCTALMDEPTLRNCAIRVCVKGREETLRHGSGGDASGDIEVSVRDGVITLDGTVISLSHKRLAGVLAWWSQGCRDVVNNLQVVPPETDTDDEVADALRIVLEKDPRVNADQLRVTSRNGAVTLEGVVFTPREKEMAELDAWYLYGVDNVINRIEVRK